MNSVEEPKKVLNLNDSFDDWNGAEMKMCDDLVYKIALTNTSDKKVMFKLKLSQKSDADTPNLRWPRNGFRGTLIANETTMLLLDKILPTERSLGDKAELEKLDLKLFIKQEAA